MNQLLSEHKLGHVGLRESVCYIAQALGLKIDTITERIEPVCKESGEVNGLRHQARGLHGERAVIDLLLVMELDASNPRDEIHIDAVPPIHMVIPGGIAGDAATARILVHTATTIRNFPPGLYDAAPWWGQPIQQLRILPSCCTGQL